MLSTVMALACVSVVMLLLWYSPAQKLELYGTETCLKTDGWPRFTKMVLSSHALLSRLLGSSML